MAHTGAGIQTASFRTADVAQHVRAVAGTESSEFPRTIRVDVFTPPHLTGRRGPRPARRSAYATVGGEEIGRTDVRGALFGDDGPLSDGRRQTGDPGPGRQAN